PEGEPAHRRWRGRPPRPERTAEIVPTHAAPQLKRLAHAILAAAGAPDDIAACVADSLVEANLKGVDSHGVVRLEWYLEQIRGGVILPAARPSLVLAAGGTALLTRNGAL